MSDEEQRYDVEIELQTEKRLRDRAISEEDETYDEVITRLLDETRITLSLEEFVDRLLEATTPAQISLHKMTGELSFVVNSPEELDESLVDDIHAIEVDSTPYPFRLERDPYGAQEVGRLTIYAPNTDGSVEPVPVDQGIENAKEWIQNRTSVGGGESKSR